MLLGGEVDSVRGPYRRDWAGLLQLLADADTTYGALSVASLPEYERNHWGRLDSLVAAGLDGFEIVNASPKANELTRARRDTVIALARRTGTLRGGRERPPRLGRHQHGLEPGARARAGATGPSGSAPGSWTRCRPGSPPSPWSSATGFGPTTGGPCWLTPIGVVWETWRGMGWAITVAWLAWIWALWIVGRTRYLPSP